MAARAAVIDPVAGVVVVFGSAPAPGPPLLPRVPACEPPPPPPPARPLPQLLTIVSVLPVIVTLAGWLATVTDPFAARVSEIAPMPVQPVGATSVSVYTPAWRFVKAAMPCALVSTVRLVP